MPDPENYTFWCFIHTPDSTGKPFLYLSQSVDHQSLAHPLPQLRLVLSHFLIVLCIQIRNANWWVRLSRMDTDALAMMMA